MLVRVLRWPSARALVTGVLFVLCAADQHEPLGRMYAPLCMWFKNPLLCPVDLVTDLQAPKGARGCAARVYPPLLHLLFFCVFWGGHRCLVGPLTILKRV